MTLDSQFRGYVPSLWGTVSCSASDLLAFGRVHLDGGAAVLSAASVAAMQTEQVLMDDPFTLGRAWGLGWILPVASVIGHDGATLGQYAFYRVHPESGTAMALLTNGPGARAVSEALMPSSSRRCAARLSPARSFPPRHHLPSRTSTGTSATTPGRSCGSRSARPRTGTSTSP